MISTHLSFSHPRRRSCARSLATLCLAVAGLSAQAGPLRYQPVVEKLEPRTLDCDVAVYGGTPAGVTAAIQAARLGKSVVLISFNGFVGGMTSGGLTATDLGKKESIGGMALEFYQRVGNLKGFRPSEAEALYREMLDEADGGGVVVDDKGAAVRRAWEAASRCCSTGRWSPRRARPAGSSRSTCRPAKPCGRRCSSMPPTRATCSPPRMFPIRSAASRPRPTTNRSAGQWQQVSWKDVYQFCRLPISPYVDPDDPESGLLPEIAKEPAGKPRGGGLQGAGLQLPHAALQGGGPDSLSPAGRLRPRPLRACSPAS